MVLLAVNEDESSLSLCEGSICEQQGLVEIPE
jgi:hypothetical protein